MSKKLFSIFLATCFMLMFVIGCSDDDDGPTGSNNNNNLPEGVPDLAALAVAIPPAMQTAANGGNAGATEAQTWLMAANSFSLFSAFLTPGSIAKLAATNDTTITWTDGELTVVMMVYEGDGYTWWSVTLNGTKDQVTYEEYEIASGSQDAQGGSMTFYGSPGSQQVLNWSWRTHEDDQFTMDYSITASSINIFITVYPDGHGSISRGSVFEEFLAEWAVNGSGAYWYYDSQGGITDSGSW